MSDTLNNQSNFRHLVFKYRYALCFLGIGMVYFFNMFIDVMDIDAAQYFSISREMLQTGSYLEVYSGGKDYLDKPPMLFWLASLSFKVLGINNFAYKLPAILMLIMGTYATYKFTKEWYNKQTALLAALILCSTQGFFLMSNDVRTDGILTGFIICSVWQLSLFIKHAQLKNLIWGSIALGGAMLTKGPIAVIIVGLAIGSDLLLKRKWRQIFNWNWILMLLIVLIILLPMCYGLYMQYDLHPEKEVYGLKGPSGIKFFFWTQSFGRITGDIYWDNGAGFFFLFQSILWDFAPWILFLIPALVYSFFRLYASKFKVNENEEYITLFGFFLSLLAISCSSFKLPHYVFPLFPFAAVLTANFIVWLSENNWKAFTRLTNVFFSIMNLFCIAPFLCFLFIFPSPNFLLPIISVLLYVLFWMFFLRSKTVIGRLMLPGMIACISFGLTMATCFYPSLLKYQALTQAGKYATEHKLPADQFYWYNDYAPSIDAYAQRIVPAVWIGKAPTYKSGTVIYTDFAGMNNLIHHYPYQFNVIKQYDRFYVTGLSIQFLFKATRAQTLEKRYLLQKVN